MTKLLAIITVVACTVLFSECSKKNKCKGVSPEFSVEDKRWLSELQVNDSVVFENQKGQLDTFYITSKAYDKILASGDKLGLEGPPCKDNDMPVANIVYSKIKKPLVSNDMFFSVNILKTLGGIDAKFNVQYESYGNTFREIPEVAGGSAIVKALGTIEVNGNLYQDVQYYENNISDFPSTTRIIYKIYYSKVSGLVRYDLGDGESWVRKKIL